MPEVIELPALPEPIHVDNAWLVKGAASRTEYFSEDQMRDYGQACAQAARAWRPIETAPKDGLLILLCTDGGIVFVGKFNKHLRIWVDDEGRERFRTVVGWMPLPPAPSGKEPTP